ncbi:hypothetical protein B0H10DRAFT_2433904 [Mycena sp. CBHHK59/15]|nr:hypothetical protein B0H10DRAFT_2433904 [Mycena sp. CBHHK59/15]
MASTSLNNGTAEQTEQTLEQMESQAQAQSESPIPILTLSRSIIRPCHVLDAPSIAREANNPLVPQWMRNLFPHPYTLLDAESWIPMVTTRLPLRNFAITRPDSTYDLLSRYYAETMVNRNERVESRIQSELNARSVRKREAKISTR